MPLEGLKGRKALVTGAATGIGRMAATALARAGASVMIASRKGEDCERVAGEINASTLNTLHNLHFYLDTLRGIRDAIAFGRFESFRAAFLQRLSRRTEDS